MQWTRLLRSVRRARGARLSVVAAVPVAISIREHASRPVDPASAEPPIAENERMEKRFELQQSTLNAVNRVHLNLPGLTYVSYANSIHANKPETVATVRVTADSPALVECVEVVPLPPHGVALKWKSKECEQMRGHLLTVLSLSREAQVNELRARGGGTVVVEDGVVVTDCEHATLRVVTEGTGDMFVTSQRNAMKLRKLQLTTLGTGKVQFVGPEQLTVQDVRLEVLGEAQMRVRVGHVDANFVKSSIAGSGEITVRSAGGMQVDKLKTSIVGSGKVVYDGEGECQVQRCTIAGSGGIEARGIRCIEASAEAYGDADVTWHVTDKLKTIGWSSTTVRYVERVPDKIEGTYAILRPTVPHSMPEASNRTATPVPPKAAAFSDIHAKYECKLDDLENLKGLPKMVRYFLDAFIDKDVSVDVHIKRGSDP